MFRKIDLASYRIAAIYCAAGLVYIWLSDWIVVGDRSPDWRPGIETLKGSLFVIASAVLIAWLARREMRHFDNALRVSHAAQRMEALGRITSGVAHDFNNLLTLVISNAEILEQELADQPEQRACAASILSAGERGAQLVTHLLTFARERPARLVEMDIGERIAALHPILERSAGAEVSVSFVPPEAPIRVLSDVAQLDAAVLNLVINARDAMPAGGDVRIAADVVVIQDADARQLQLMPGDYGVISVSDAGTGMTPEVARKAFEPFFTTKEPGKGTGLGLSSVYGFLRQCGGLARINSRPGHGTTVQLYFPLNPSKPHSSCNSAAKPCAFRIEDTDRNGTGKGTARCLALYCPVDARRDHAKIQNPAS